MRLIDVLAQLGGGDKEVLRELPRERSRFAQVGGTSLCTAVIAALSMFFALHGSLRVALAFAIVLCVFWGVVVFSIDRLLVVSVSAASGTRLALVAVYRLVLTAGIAVISSTALAIRIFTPEIAAELRAANGGTGLAAQLHALAELSGHDPAVTWTCVITGLLFFILSVLPFTAASMRLQGLSPYGALVEARDNAARVIFQHALDSKLYIAELEARRDRDIAALKLDRDAQAAQEVIEMGRRVELDLLRREEGTRIEANKTFAAATRDHILTGVNEWAEEIRASIRKARDGEQREAEQPPAISPPRQEATSAYELPDAGLI